MSELRRTLLALSLFNAAKLISEQQQQQPPTPPPSSSPEAPPAPPPAEPAPPAPPAPQDTVPPAAGAGGSTPSDDQGTPITLDKVVRKMNIIRSGQSFQDPEVYGKLTTFFNGMQADDKVRFSKYLSDIGAIVQSQTPQDQQQQAPAPPEAAPAEAPPPAQPPPPAAA